MPGVCARILTIESLFYRRVFLAAEVSRAEVDEFLQQESGLFMGARYRLRHILIAANDDANRTNRRRYAASLRGGILGGDDFADVAKRESDDKSAQAGGDLGFLKETDLPDIFIDAARELTIGGNRTLNVDAVLARKLHCRNNGAFFFIAQKSIFAAMRV